MTDSANYIKIVEWIPEDNCFVGQCPGIIGPCCHGPNEGRVYTELCKIVDEWIANMKRSGHPLPPPTIGRNVSDRILQVA
jgi:hypothetical protein